MTQGYDSRTHAYRFRWNRERAIQIFGLDTPVDDLVHLAIRTSRNGASVKVFKMVCNDYHGARERAFIYSPGQPITCLMCLALEGDFRVGPSIPSLQASSKAVR